MAKDKSVSNILYWKISAILLSLLVVLGVMYVIITGYIGGQYLQEVNQRLYGTIADSTVAMIQLMENGEPDEASVKKLMSANMVINPSVEFYLLDTLGKIKTHAAPPGRVKMEQVDLAPILKFIEAKEKPFIQGEDPRNPGICKVFSAAKVKNKDTGSLEGYLYIILASEEQAAVTSTLFGSYMLKLGTNWFLLALVGALAIGLLAIWLLTRNLRSIIETVQRFKEGDYKARIADDDKGDLNVLADTFNEMADRIVANIDELKSVEKLRRELIANVSHDLRTPLAIMQGYVETMLLKEPSLNQEERKKYLEIVLSSSEKLSKLITQLFEYSKLEANQIQPQKEPFFLSELAQDVLAKYKILAEEKHIELQLIAPKDLPLVFADVSLVERVIQNLMDNALKFTPEKGEIRLLLKAVENGVEVTVSDTGPGIPKSEQVHIFERYGQASLTKKQSKGAGLGLAIVKKILEIHNATIQVQSQPNQGASFLFKLPVYQGA